MCPIFVGSVHNFGKSEDDIYSEKMLIFNRCIKGLMSNLIKKSLTVTTIQGTFSLKLFFTFNCRRVLKFTIFCCLVTSVPRAQIRRNLTVKSARKFSLPLPNSTLNSIFNFEAFPCKLDNF